jgi:hypothetical protein
MHRTSHGKRAFPAQVEAETALVSDESWTVPRKLGSPAQMANDLAPTTRRQPYSAGCGSRAFSTPLARTAIMIAATRKPIATIAVTPSTRPKPPRP